MKELQEVVEKLIKELISIQEKVSELARKVEELGDWADEHNTKNSAHGYRN